MKPRLSFSLGDRYCARPAADQTPTPAVAIRNSRRVFFVMASLKCSRRFTFLRISWAIAVDSLGDVASFELARKPHCLASCEAVGI